MDRVEDYSFPEPLDRFEYQRAPDGPTLDELVEHVSASRRLHQLERLETLARVLGTDPHWCEMFDVVTRLADAVEELQVRIGVLEGKLTGT